MASCPGHLNENIKTNASTEDWVSSPSTHRVEHMLCDSFLHVIEVVRIRIGTQEPIQEFAKGWGVGGRVLKKAGP